MLGVLILIQACSEDIKAKATNIKTNEATPVGRIIAQGSFQGTNGRATTGTAAIYLEESGIIVLRLESFKTEVSNSLQVSIKGDGQIVYSNQLKANSGNQNYPMEVSVGAWNSVTIFSSVIPPPTNDFGVALLQTP